MMYLRFAVCWEDTMSISSTASMRCTSLASTCARSRNWWVQGWFFGCKQAWFRCNVEWKYVNDREVDMESISLSSAQVHALSVPLTPSATANAIARSHLPGCYSHCNYVVIHPRSTCSSSKWWCWSTWSKMVERNWKTINRTIWTPSKNWLLLAKSLRQRFGYTVEFCMIMPVIHLSPCFFLC